MIAVEIVLTALAALTLLFSGWWLLLALVALRRPRPAEAGEPSRPWRVAVIVPAHNEEAIVGSCIESLQAAALRSPAEIVVVADNCDDRTAAVAAEHGVAVLERHDRAAMGKGFALEYALADLTRRVPPPDAVCFVDADTEVSSNFIEACVTRFDGGAEAVQVYYQAGEGDSPLGRLRRLAFMLVHWARQLGAERLRLGTGIKGNGMALRWDVASAGLGGGGITEDAAMTLALANRGVAVRFEPRAWVRGHMAGDYETARTQDHRWERGRLELMCEGVTTGLRATARGRLACAAAAFEVASPALSLIAVAAVATLVASLAAGSAAGAVVAGASVAALVGYVAIGLTAARAPLADVAALRHAPRFVGHKLLVFGALLARRGPTTWERTRRP